MKLKLAALALVIAAIAAADVVSMVVQQQLTIQGGLPGQSLIIGPDGRSVVSVPAKLVVLASPTAPGCVATSTPGRYVLSVAPLSVAVYRNGMRASMPGEFSISANLVTLANPMPGEVVLCDYTK